MSRQSICSIIAAAVFAFAVLAVVNLGIRIITYENAECEAKGGTMVRVSGGRACVNVEKLE